MSNAQHTPIQDGLMRELGLEQQVIELRAINAQLLVALEAAVATAQANAGQLHYDDVQAMLSAIAAAKGGAA